MREEDLVDVEGIAASSHELATRYGTFRMNVEELQALAKAMVSGEGHFNAHHDPGVPWEARNVQAWVEETGGHYYLKYRLR